MMAHYVAPYKFNIGLSLLFNVLSAVLNVFSFASLIPMLKLLFNTEQKVYHFIDWGKEGMSFSDIAVNNAYYYTSQLVVQYGAGTALLFIGLFLVLSTALKTASYFASVASMVPVRTGIVRDIRTSIYKKITLLPLSFFSDERKGDIIARMSGDVGEIENSIMGSLEMLMKNPILLVVYFGSLFYISWELTLFTILVLPLMGWGMGRIGRKLKQSSMDAQIKWSETMSQLEETLGGMRIIKAFGAERKMQERYDTTANDFRSIASRVAIRQGSAHPVSEFLGTCLIVLVLWYGGTLIFADHSPIDAPTFIFYMVILYSVIQPLKDLSRAAYSIPKGMASMERVNKILLAENPICEPEHPVKIGHLTDCIAFKNVTFAYGQAGAGADAQIPDEQMVIRGVDFTVKRGQTIALVGQSGSGKSTLVDLVPRYHDVVGGCITIDGTDVRQLRLSDLRALIGNVNQEAILFNDSFFNNIAFGVENATLEQVIEAAKVANAAAVEAKDKVATAQTAATAAAASAEKAQATAQAAQVAVATKAEAADVAALRTVHAQLSESVAQNTANISTNTANISKNAAAITQNSSRIDALDRDIANFRKETRQGMATQAALTGLFQPYHVGKFSVTAALGGFKSDTAIAVGTGYRFNENFAVKTGLAVSTSSSDAAAYNVGVNYEW